MNTAAPTQSLSDQYAQAAGAMHMTFVLVLLAAWAFMGRIMMDRMVAGSSPHRIRMYVLTMVFEWLLFAYVVWGVRRHGAPVEIVLGTRWHSFRHFIRDIGVAAVFWMIAAGILAILARLLHAGAPRRELQLLLPHGTFERALWIALSVTAGICEEAIFRGYLQRQLVAFTKSVPAGILLSAAAFGAGHAYQGSRMMILIGLYGAMFGILAHWRGSVRPGMIAHAWQDSLDGLVAVTKVR